MFNEIILHDYSKPLATRTRKYTGPYRWKPSEPGKGRGFYMDSKRMICAPHGSGFDLRLEDANDLLPSHSRLSRINGYYINRYQDESLKPIVARLPHGRGFLAGWTMGQGMASSLDSYIWKDAEEAARAAHDLAESDADEMFEAEEDAEEESEE